MRDEDIEKREHRDMGEEENTRNRKRQTLRETNDDTDRH